MAIQSPARFLQGYIDLTICSKRWFVVDYKSNLLENYQSAACERRCSNTIIYYRHGFMPSPCTATCANICPTTIRISIWAALVTGLCAVSPARESGKSGRHAGDARPRSALRGGSDMSETATPDVLENFRPLARLALGLPRKNSDDPRANWIDPLARLYEAASRGIGQLPWETLRGDITDEDWPRELIAVQGDLAMLPRRAQAWEFIRSDISQRHGQLAREVDDAAVGRGWTAYC